MDLNILCGLLILGSIFLVLAILAVDESKSEVKG